MESTQNWQSILYNGLVPDTGRPAKVATGNITKAMTQNQLSERMAAAPEVVNNNTRNRGLLRKSKQRFSIHRSMSFLSQE